MHWHQLIKKVFPSIISIFFIPIKSIIKRKRIIVLQAHNRQVYCNNTRYLYEYLSKKQGVEVYWFTDNPEIKQYIGDNGWKYVTWKNPFQLILVALRVRVVIDNGDGFFNIFNITSVDSVIKICCGHGSGPKATLDRSSIAIITRQILNINKFDYVNFPSRYFSEALGKKTYFLPNEKILTFGYPRCDSFFDDEIIKNNYKKRQLTKTIKPLIKKNDKVILYTPTWRPYKYNFPLSEMPDFSFEKFNEWLDFNHLFFFYTVHSNLFPENIPEDLDRMVFINPELNPLFDINEFMMEADILVNDYSTTSTDFSILNRPQIFYMPDYDYYNLAKCFIEPYRDIMPGNEVLNYSEFTSALLDASLNPKVYVDKHLAAKKKLQEKYYNIDSRSSTINMSEFILKLL